MRFREPEYLMFALAGAAYLVFLLVLRLQTASLASGPDAPPSPIDQLPILAGVGPTLAGFAFLTVAAGSWLFPGGGLLRFTRAEVQFLFPGPVSRRRLVIHRMLRAQLGLLFGSFVSVVVLPSASMTTRLRIGLTLWVLLFTAKVYFAGVTVTRARMASADSRERFTGRLTIAAIVGAFLVVAAALAFRLYSAPLVGVADTLERLTHSTLPTVVRALLWPFAALARPLFAGDWPSFLSDFAGAAAILVVVSIWVMSGDNTFERVATEPGLLESEDGRKRPAYAGRRASWQLTASGQSETAFAWKAAVQTFRIVDRRVLVRVIAIVTWLAVVVVSSNRGRGLATIVGLFATTAVGMAVLVGPLTLRLDFREDLRHLEVLKTWPVPGAAAIRGMLLWPTVLLTAASWTMTLLALLLSSAAFPDSPFPDRAAVAIGAMIVSPALIAAQLAIHNAAALAFPAWMATGSERSRGIDAIGQRLLLIGGGMLLLGLACVPGALAAWVVWSFLSPFAGIAVILPAALVGASLLGAQVLAAAEVLAPLYDRLDLTAIERPEV
jgi:hypothetical protein